MSNTTRKERILAGLKAVLEERKVGNIETLELEKDLVKDCGMDSLDSVEMVMGLEDKFGIEIPNETTGAKDFRFTVGAVVDIIEGLLPEDY